MKGSCQAFGNRLIGDKIIPMSNCNFLILPAMKHIMFIYETVFVNKPTFTVFKNN